MTISKLLLLSGIATTHRTFRAMPNQSNGTPIFKQSLKLGGAGTYNFIDQTITRPLQAVGPHSSVPWFIDLNGHLVVYTDPTLTCIAGLPQGFIDAGNTLSIVGFSVFDATGKPLPQSALGSMNGYDYTRNATAPEPASFFLLCRAGALLSILPGQRAPFRKSGS